MSARSSTRLLHHCASGSASGRMHGTASSERIVQEANRIELLSAALPVFPYALGVEAAVATRCHSTAAAAYWLAMLFELARWMVVQCVRDLHSTDHRESGAA